tara:strand:- start:1807 stop:2415 length:609 start_codon:yes stop_codon:yes gene_type:complete
MSNILHSNNTAEWYTPAGIIERVRTTMAGITLDPCSNTLANRVVKASLFYNASDDGLSKTWVGKVYVNPPSKCGEPVPVPLNDHPYSHTKLVHPHCGGTRCRCKLPRRFMHHMFEQYYEGCVTHAVYLGYSLSQLKYLEDMHFDHNDVRICILRKRIKFWQPGEHSTSPTQDNFVLLLSNDLAVRTRFDEQFGEMGVLVQTL